MIFCEDTFLCFAGCGCYLDTVVYLICPKGTDYLHEAIKKNNVRPSKCVLLNSPHNLYTQKGSLSTTSP